MNPRAPVSRDDLQASLLPEWPADLLPSICAEAGQLGRTVVVLDDDPTGTQTVANVPVVTEWTVEALAAALVDSPGAFYVLTNSRALPEAGAIRLARALANNLAAAICRTERNVDIISRSDSTLRGHFPAEIQALQASLSERAGWQWQGTVLVPFFAEGRRVTVNDIQWIEEGDHFTPVHQTEFARDPDFGYHTSWLPGWVAEKSQGALTAQDVQTLSLNALRSGGPDASTRALSALTSDNVLVVNALTNRDVEAFVLGALRAEAGGSRFLYRTAASFVRARLGQAPQPLLAATELVSGGTPGGLIVVGSYVERTTRQLERLWANGAVESLEISASAVLDPGRRAAALTATTGRVNASLTEGRDVVVYTSRGVLPAADRGAGRVFSEVLAEIVRGLVVRPRYLIAKGGITSSVVATDGLGIRRAQVVGQIMVGVPVWRAGSESRFPGLAYVVFPGNVGDEMALADLVATLQSAEFQSPH